MNKTTKICLNAMVANESNTIVRMLDSCYQYIDYWVIQDNGSTDGTQEIIKEYFTEKNIPGMLYEIEWQFPGWNRDHALQTCLESDHGCDWILRMDADERLHVDDDFDWTILNDTSVVSYNIVAQASDCKYFRTWFWNARLPWFFQHDKRHETIHLPELGENFQRINMPYGFRHLVSQDGQTWMKPRKFLRDALELEIDKVVGDTVLEDMYHLWYLAKSYYDCHGNPDELAFGKKHSDEYARRSIWYFERYLEQVHEWTDEVKSPKVPDEMAYLALLFIAQLYRFIGDDEMASEYYKICDKFLGIRNEHLVYYAEFLFERGAYDDALYLVDIAMRPDRVNPFPGLSVLIEDRCYYNSSDYLSNFRKNISNKLNQPKVDMNSFKFEFE
jgi:glycosyltransferase involved in cell wall biosynthesis